MGGGAERFCEPLRLFAGAGFALGVGDPGGVLGEFAEGGVRDAAEGAVVLGGVCRVMARDAAVLAEKDAAGGVGAFGGGLAADFGALPGG